MDLLDRQMAELDEQIRDATAPVTPWLDPLTSMPGLQETTARAIVAEIGADLSRFGSTSRLASWAGCVRGRTKAQASGAAAARARAIGVCGGRWCSV